MFDTYEHHSHSHSHSVEITEKRAPTDDSVRLLRDMEKAAQDKVIKSIRFEANGFKFLMLSLAIELLGKPINEALKSGEIKWR